MLHSMDYVNSTDFNHPLIITVGFAAFINTCIRTVPAGPNRLALRFQEA